MSLLVLNRSQSFLKELFFSALLVIGVFLGANSLLRILPGNPLQAMLSESGSTLDAQNLSEEMGLNRPLFESLFQDLNRLIIHRDLGRSLISREQLSPLVWNRLKKTALLAALTSFITVILSLTLGILATQSVVASRFTLLFGSITTALPLAWIAPLLIYLFAVKLPLFQVGQSPVLPALCLGLLQTGFWARAVKIQMSESLINGSATGARARGIPEVKVLLKYGFFPVAGPLIALYTTQFGHMLAGAYFTEILFDWPGMGNLFLDSVLRRDYPAVQACIFVSASTTLLGVRLGGFFQRLTNPQMDDKKSGSTP